MSLVAIRTITNLLKYFGIKKEAEHLHLSLDGKCMMLDCEIHSTTTQKVEVVKKGKTETVDEVDCIWLCPINKDLRNAQAGRADLGRILVEVNPELHKYGVVTMSQQIIEPMIDKLEPRVKIKLNAGVKLPAKFEKAIRLYVLE